MALILCLETATNVCSVALGEDRKCISIRESREDKSHASLLTLFIEDILQEKHLTIKDLDAIAVSKGPGSYTGLRIGVSVAKGLCYGADIPLISVGSLQVLSGGILQSLADMDMITHDNSFWICPMIDARRMEVYTAFFDASGKPLTDVQAIVIDENSFRNELDEQKIYFAGDGMMKSKTVINHSNAVFLDDIFSSARYMIEYAYRAFGNENFEDVAYFEPFYLKDFIATIPKNKFNF